MPTGRHLEIEDHRITCARGADGDGKADRQVLSGLAVTIPGSDSRLATNGVLQRAAKSDPGQDAASGGKIGLDWAHHIKDLRRTRGIATQAELAEMVGVDPVTVSRWETGQHQPDILYRRRLLDLTRSRDGGADRAIIAAARQAPGAVALLDAGGDVAITASQELCRLQGLSYAEYIQTNWRGRYSDMAEIALKTPVIERMLLCGEIVAITVCSRASSVKGATYCVNAVFFPVWLSAGEMIMRLSAVTSPDDQFSGPGIDFIAREEV